MDSVIISPIPQFAPSLSRSSSISSFWSRSRRVSPKKAVSPKKTGFSAWFRRVNNHESTTDVVNVGYQLNSDAFYHNKDGSVEENVLHDLESYLQSETPTFKAKQRGSTLRSIRHLIHEHSPRKGKEKLRRERSRLKMNCRRYHRFRLFEGRRPDADQSDRNMYPSGDNNSDGISLNSELSFDSHSDEPNCQYEGIDENPAHHHSPLVIEINREGDDFDKDDIILEGINILDALQYSPLHDFNFEKLELLKKRMLAFPNFTLLTDNSFERSVQPLKATAIDSSDIFEAQSKEDESAHDDRIEDITYEDLSSPETPQFVRDLFFDGLIHEANTETTHVPSSLTLNSSPLVYSSIEEAQLDDLQLSVPIQALSSFQRMYTYFGQVKSAIVGDTEPYFTCHVETQSSDSSYSPVGVTVPTLRRPNFLGELTDAISVGDCIERLYGPESQQEGVNCTSDENVPLFSDIRDPGFFEAFIPPVKPMLTSNSACADKKSSIRFDTFSHVLFYNKESTIHSLNNNQRMSTTNISIASSVPHLKKSVNILELHHSLIPAKLPLTLGSSDYITSLSGSGLMSLQYTDTMGREKENEPKSILRRRYNKNAEQESIRMAESDQVEIKDFMVLFDTTERQRMDSAPLLEDFREQQLNFYYTDVDEQCTKQLMYLDSL